MASVVILSVAITPVIGMFDAGLKTATGGGSYDQAWALVNEKLEEIEALASKNDASRSGGVRLCGDDVSIDGEYADLSGGETTPTTRPKTRAEDRAATARILAWGTVAAPGC